jgi:uncharacterized protein (DUF433 family)
MSDSRIVLDPEVLAGKPVIRGTRISVEFVLELMAAGWSVEDILGNYPHLRPEDLAACLDYAKELVSAERVFPGAA